MSRPTRVYIDPQALIHNVGFIRNRAPGRKIIAMVKANAYGSGLSSVIPVLDGQVDAFGVACLEEAITVRKIDNRTDCILFQSVFSQDEFHQVLAHNLQCVIHQQQELNWLLQTPLERPIKVWIKVDTGMHRLGFFPHEVFDVATALMNCPWVENDMGIITHLASSDEPENSSNIMQMQDFANLFLPAVSFTRSIANSAAILALDDSHADAVRPGIMLYGVSPFADKTGAEIGLKPVMHFLSAISAIHHYPAGSPVGYGGTWQSDKPSIIGIVPVGYGDGYPRHIASNTPVWINDEIISIVGRVSMDMLAVDLTQQPQAKVGDTVELWGSHIPVETIAKQANTIAYELLCQLSTRVKR